MTVNINALGLRGPEVTVPKPSGVVRLYSTGDSSIFGFGVEDTETFTTIAAERLNAAGGAPRVEPVIGAIPGYSTFQSINLLNLRGLKTDPDLFVIANLWSDNNFDSFVDKDVLATTSGFETSITARTRDLFTRSAVFRLLDWRFRVRDSVGKVQQVGWMQQSRGQLGPRRVSINDYAGNLERLVDMATGRGADVVFVLPANNEDLGSEGSDKAWTPYRKVMRETALRHGAPLVDVPAVFIESGLSRDALFLDEMHPTVAGHRLMGEALARTLSERGWPGEAPWPRTPRASPSPPTAIPSSRAPRRPAPTPSTAAAGLSRDSAPCRVPSSPGTAPRGSYSSRPSSPAAATTPSSSARRASKPARRSSGCPWARSMRWWCGPTATAKGTAPPPGIDSTT